MKIGILAIQGDYEAHGRMLDQLHVEYLYVRRPQHLHGVDGLILPGGESTTMLKFLSENDFLQAIKNFAQTGHYLLGTCAGAILLAKTVINPTQQSLGLVNITIERNAFGRQLASHIGRGHYVFKEDPVEMVFIRAPRICAVGENVTVFASYQNEPVGVESGRCLLATFHPELTQDLSLHEYFIKRLSL
jgi:5'-phosphate synthase pdxT subunit